MTFHPETACRQRPDLITKGLRSLAGILLSGAFFTVPDASWAASATIGFSGYVPMRDPVQETSAGAQIVVGFSDRVLLPVPAIAESLGTGEIRLQAMGRPRDESVWHFSWRAKEGRAPPAFVEVPLESADEAWYQLCVHSKQNIKKQCRAYRIIPAPGIKP